MKNKRGNLKLKGLDSTDRKHDRESDAIKYFLGPKFEVNKSFED